MIRLPYMKLGDQILDDLITLAMKQADIEDLPAMTDLANLIRKKAFFTMQRLNVEAKGEKTLEEIAGIIAVSVLMDGKFIEAARTTIQDVDDEKR